MVSDYPIEAFLPVTEGRLGEWLIDRERLDFPSRST